MGRFRFAAYGAVVAVFFVTVGCAFGGPTPPSRFYLLAPLESAGDARGGVSLGVGPIRLAEYLDRPQIVTRRGAFALDLAEFDRWGEPLRESISRVLAANLAALLGTERVERHPWRDARGIDAQVELDVRHFDGPVQGPIELVAHWRVRQAGGSTQRISRIREALEGSGYEAIAAAMSRGLSALSREIAEAVAGSSSSAPREP